MSAKTGGMIALILCAAVLAYVIGTRLSDEAINIIVGAICGIAATVPVSLGLLLALTRRRAEPEEPEESRSYPEPIHTYAPRHAPQNYPPVIVVASPQSQFPAPPARSLPSGNMYEMPAARDFKIIGDYDD